jgi:hypothetical protein
MFREAIDETNSVNFFVKLTVTFSPALILANCYMNACLAHNIYITYYDYRKTYKKRILFYKFSALFLSFLIYLITIFNLDFSNKSLNEKHFTFMLYSVKYINFFYWLHFLMIIYILHNIYYIMSINSDYVTLNSGKK